MKQIYIAETVSTVPFWNEILDKPPEELASIAVQVGHWAKVNIQWLSNSRVPQMIRFLQSIPDLFPRLLLHLPSVSSISDILSKLVNIDDQHPDLKVINWLSEEKLVDKVLDLLDPRNNSVAAHGPAGDFLRGIVAAASAASASKQHQQQQQQQHQQGVTGEINAASLGLNGATGDNSAWSNWPNNTLVRELASRKTVERLLNFMLDARPSRNPKATAQSERDETQTPTPTTPTSAPTFHPTMSDPMRSEITSTSVTPEASTSSVSHQPSHSFTSLTSSASTESFNSSLLICLMLLIDLIRKNNSDFTELQILQYLERSADEEETFSSDDSDSDDAEGSEPKKNKVMEQGPSLVDLGPLLECVTQRLPDIHHLLLNPRSDVSRVLCRGNDCIT